MDHHHLIKRLGGPVELGRKLKLNSPDSRFTPPLHWGARGIPFRHVPAVVELAREVGIEVTAQDLIATKPATTQKAA